MKIELKEVTVSELTANYQDNAESGVTGYGGELDIRPPYQREFIYKDKQRDAVIDTITKNFPLNVMYWAARTDGHFEVIDGQQRTISICQYVSGDFSINGLAFHNLTDDRQRQILDYKLMVYFCEGADSEKLEWFKTINISGERLTSQELRNAVYAGSWVSDAKRYFSKTGCAAYQVGNKYLNGSAIRQEYLEKALEWQSNSNIEDYMSQHQHDKDASELWQCFQNIINWVEVLFPKYRKEMKGLDWGAYYNKFKDRPYNAAQLEKEVARLMADDDVEKKSGIYLYLLTNDERHLNIRAFTPSQKRTAYEKQHGICKKCGEHFEIDQMEGDHITPWHEGGKTEPVNLQMLCKDCNRRKSGK